MKVRWMVADLGFDSPCWVWWGYTRKDGYGVVVVDGRRMLAHRALFEEYVRPLAPTEVAHHRCHIKPCVNPAHLEPMALGTHTRLHVPRLTHCQRGHAFDDWNTVIRDGKRRCRECLRLHQRRYAREAGVPEGPTRKLYPDAVRDIRSSDEPLAVLAARYGVHIETARYAMNGHTWRSVT